jgi:hypothetical protein
MLFEPHLDFGIEQGPMPFDPQEPTYYVPERLAERCKKTIDAAERLQFLRMNGIEEHRRANLAQMRDICEFETVRMRDWRNPSVLREYRPAAACSTFIDALEGKTDVMALHWQTLKRDCQQNASPDSCIDDGLAKIQKPDGMDWARLYLMTFGWNKCATKYVSRNADRDRLEEQRRSLELQFRRMFRVVKSRCEDPQDRD